MILTQTAINRGTRFCCKRRMPLFAALRPAGSVPFFSPAVPETEKHGKLYHSASLHDIIKHTHKAARRLLKNTCKGEHRIEPNLFR